MLSYPACVERLRGRPPQRSSCRAADLRRAARGSAGDTWSPPSRSFGARIGSGRRAGAAARPTLVDHDEIAVPLYLRQEVVDLDRSCRGRAARAALEVEQRARGRPFRRRQHGDAQGDRPSIRLAWILRHAQVRAPAVDIAAVGARDEVRSPLGERHGSARPSQSTRTSAATAATASNGQSQRGRRRRGGRRYSPQRRRRGLSELLLIARARDPSIRGSGDVLAVLAQSAVLLGR